MDLIKKHKTLTALGLVTILLVSIAIGLQGSDFAPLYISDEDASFTKSSANYQMGSVAPSYGGMEMAKDSFDSRIMPAPMVPGFAANQPDRLVIKNADMSIIATDVKQAIANIETEIMKRGGFVINSNISNFDDTPSGWVEVRVPSAQLSDMMAYITNFSVRVTNQNVNGLDVTEEFVDTEARLKQMRSLETKLTDLLKDANTVQDSLQVYNELNRVQSEIESMQARLDYLKESADLSRLTVNIALDEANLPTVPESQEWRPIVVIKQAWAGVLSILKWLGSAMIWIVILGVIWIPLLAATYLIRRRKQKKGKR